MSETHRMRKKHKIKEEHTLFVSDINPKISEDDLRNHFLRCGGKVEYLRLIKKRRKDSNTYAFVEFETRADYDNVLRATSHFIKGCKIVIGDHQSCNEADEKSAFTRKNSTALVFEFGAENTQNNDVQATFHWSRNGTEDEPPLTQTENILSNHNVLQSTSNSTEGCNVVARVYENHQEADDEQPSSAQMNSTPLVFEFGAQNTQNNALQTTFHWSGSGAADDPFTQRENILSNHNVLQSTSNSTEGCNVVARVYENHQEAEDEQPPSAQMKNMASKKRMCEACNCRFESARELKKHLQSYKHTKRLKRNMNEKNSIFVGRLSFPVKTGDLKNYFAQFGEVKNALIDKAKNSRLIAFVEFETRAGHDRALQATSHRIKGCNVVVTQMNSKPSTFAEHRTQNARDNALKTPFRWFKSETADERNPFLRKKNMVSKKLVCEVCNFKFESVHDLKTHLQSSMHAKILKQNMNGKNSIFVGRLNSAIQTDDLKNYFSQFGEVKNVLIDQMKSQFGFVEFANASDCAKVFKGVHHIKHHTVFVRFREVFEQNKAPVRKVPLDILTQLKSCHSASHAIDKFCLKLSLQESEISDRNQICADVQSVLREFYPTCYVHIYGSTMNGCGITGCGLDILFEPSLKYVVSNTFKERKTPIKDFSELLANLKQHKMVVEDYPPNIHLQLVRRIMDDSRNLFYFVRFIPTRRVIIRFTHKRTELQCDLCCDNRLVLHNTQLLRTFGLLDGRVRPLMVLLHFLAKKKGLIRGNDISSYAFSLMVIFSLQNTHPPVLPNVLYLKSLPASPRHEAGWDCTFCTDRRRVPPSENEDSIADLLVKFFTFYDAFDFALVICPLTGQATYRHVFENSDVQDHRNFQTSPLCIQDPLELNRNVTAMVNVKVLISLKEWIRSSLSKLQSTSVGVSDILDLFKGSQPSPKVQTSKLITESVYEVDIKDSEEKFKGRQMFVFTFSTELQEKMKCTPGDVLGKICCIVLRSLEYGLLFETQTIDRIDILPVLEKSKFDVNSVPRKRKRGSSDSDSMPEVGLVEPPADDPFPGSWKFTAIKNENWSSRDPTKPELVLAVQCVTHANTWHGRKSYAESNRRNKSKAQAGWNTYKCKTVGESLEQEHEVSVLMSNDSKNALVNPFCFGCRCYVYQKDKQENLRFVVTQGKKSSKELNSFCLFLKSFLLSVLKMNL